MNKPRLNETCLVTWKNGKQLYCNFEAIIYEDEEHDNTLKIHEQFTPCFAEEAKDLDCNWELDNVESYKALSTKDEWLQFNEHEKDYWKNNWISLHIRDKQDRAEKSWNEVIQDPNFIEFLTTWVDHIGYSDGEIDNPSYSLYKVYRSGYNQAMKEIKKELEYLEDDLK